MPLIPESVYNLTTEKKSVTLDKFRISVTSAPMLFKINFCSLAYNKCKVKYRTEEVSMADKRNFENYLDRGTIEVYEMFKSVNSPDEEQRVRGLVCFYAFLDRIDIVLRAAAGDKTALEQTRKKIQLPTARPQTKKNLNNPVVKAREAAAVQQILRNARLRRRIRRDNEIIDLTLSNELNVSEEDDAMESNNQTESMGNRNLENNNNNNSELGTQNVNGLISDQIEGNISNENGNNNGSEISVIDLDDYTEVEDNIVPEQYRSILNRLINSREEIPLLLQSSIDRANEEFAQNAPHLPVEPEQQPEQQPEPNVEGTNSADPNLVNGSNEPTGEELHDRVLRYSPPKLNEFVMNIQPLEATEENEVEVIELSGIVENVVSEVVEEINGNGNVREEVNAVSIENNNNNNEVSVVNNGNEEGKDNVVETIADNIQVVSICSSSHSSPMHMYEVESGDEKDEFFSCYSTSSRRKREMSAKLEEKNKKAKC